MLKGMDLVSPAEIERQSFATITAELGERQFSPQEGAVVKRAIHATADFDFADHLHFSPQAVEAAVQALQRGASIITDTKMVAAGINRPTLTSLGGQVHCFIDDPEVAAVAKQLRVTRSAICMERAASLTGHLIFAIGNAPTALWRLHELVSEQRLQPTLVIGVPVGFVNVVESKQLILGSSVPHIVAEGRKGGSTVAAAICNALIYLAAGRQV